MELNDLSKDQTLSESDKGLLVNVDEYLGHIGEFGKMQQLLQVMFCLMIIPATYQTLLLTFVGNNPSWRCTGLHQECNQTGIVFDISNQFYQKRCEMENRTSWEFVQPKRFSIVTEWDLVCKDKELSYLANSAIFLGWAVGALILSAVADRYGRKSVLFPSLGGIIILGFVSGFVQNFWLFFVTRLLIGFAQGGVGLSLYVLAAELVGPSYRALSGTIIWFAFTLALCVIGLKAWLVPDWRLLEIIVSAPYIFVLIFWKFVPESVRWLRVNGRVEEAEAILRKAGRVNGKPKPTVKLSVAQKETSHGTYMDLFRPWSTCRDTLIQCYAWFVNGMVYYGVSLASDNLGGNMYRDFALTSLVEVPATVVTIVLLEKIGRKKTAILAMAGAGLFCCSIIFFPGSSPNKAYSTVRIVAGMAAKLCNVVAFSAYYVWTVELHPTTIRTQGLSFASLFARVGCTTSPFIAEVLKLVFSSLPFLIMGVLSLIAGFTSVCLPDTNGDSSRELQDLPLSITPDPPVKTIHDSEDEIDLSDENNANEDETLLVRVNNNRRRQNAFK